MATGVVSDLWLRVAYVTERDRGTEARASTSADVDRRETKMATVCKYKRYCVDVHWHVLVGILFLNWKKTGTC